MKSQIAIALVLAAVQSLAGAQPPAQPLPQGQRSTPAVTSAADMKTIGIIGGITWLSSAEYYRIINQQVQATFGGVSSAKVLLYSIEFGEFSRQERLALAGDFGQLDQTMLVAAAKLKRGGADFVVIASNTMNTTADLIEQTVGIPVVRMPEVVGNAIKHAGVRKVVLLGTKYTMEAPYYRAFLEKNFGIEVVVPDLADRDFINAVIFDQLAAGQFLPESRQRFVQITEGLVRRSGADGVILGCTEIPLLIGQKDISVKVFDTTQIHAEAAVRRAIE